MRLFKSAAEKAAERLEKGDYAKAAELYQKAGLHAEAAKIFEGPGKDLDKAVAAWEKAAEPAKAAEVLFGAGRSREAVGRFQAAGLPKRAAEACLDSGQAVRAGDFYEQAGQLARAADCYVEGGDVERALAALEKEEEDLRSKSGNRPGKGLRDRLHKLGERRAELLQKLERFLDAARLVADLGKAAEAAALFEDAEDLPSAIRAYLEADLEAEALRLVRQHDDIPRELAAQTLLENACWEEAAAIFDELGKFDAAASAFEDAGDPIRGAEMWDKAGSHLKAAKLFADHDRAYDAGQCYARAGRDLLAAEHFELAGALRNAADAYLNSEPPRPLRAGKLYLEAGLESEALDVLQSIRPGHVDYASASLLLVLPLLAAGSLESAARRLSYLQERMDQLDRHQLLEFHYLRGRVLESRHRLGPAVSAYRMVVAQETAHRDATKRLETLEERLETETGHLEIESGSVDLGATGLTGYLEAHPHATQRVPLRPSNASTGSLSAEVLKASKAGFPTSGSHASIADVPFAFEDRISPWWEGAEFLRGRDSETGDRTLVVSFPLAHVGERADSFEYILRQVQAVRHGAILELRKRLMASDKVLLFYEDFDGVPLADEIGAADHSRDFSPRTALHLLLQLCEALTSAHKLGLTHQWLSPRTILVDHENRCKLVGLGLREFLAASDATSRAYLSPEVAEDAPVIGPTSDVYSLGILAMQLLEVQLPVDWRENLDPERFGWPRLVSEEIPSSLRNFLVRCLDRDPLARPSTAELAAALTSIGFSSGQLLAERYEVIREIGRGGMSRVYRAVDLDLGGEVAIKTVLTPALGRTEDEERLFREAQISRRITHSNVVRVHDLGRFPGGIFIIMELLEGPGLDDIIRDEAPLPKERVRRILTEVTDALSEAHRLAIVHRDLKPGNVILVDDRAKVLDFGIARVDDGTSSHLTRTGEVIGSPLYMSPEQIKGKEIDGRSDLYSLGVIGYTLLTGREPFAADSPTEVVMKHLNDPPPDMRQHLPDLEDEWIHLISRLLRKDPAERYASAKDLLGPLADLPP